MTVGNTHKISTAGGTKGWVAYLLHLLESRVCGQWILLFNHTEYCTIVAESHCNCCHNSCSGKCTAYKYPGWCMGDFNTMKDHINSMMICKKAWLKYIDQSPQGLCMPCRYSWSESRCNCCHIFCFRKVHYILLLRMVIWTGWNPLLMEELISTLQMKMG